VLVVIDGDICRVAADLRADLDYRTVDESVVGGFVSARMQVIAQPGAERRQRRRHQRNSERRAFKRGRLLFGSFGFDRSFLLLFRSLLAFGDSR
jgi:hypothetical protein